MGNEPRRARLENCEGFGLSSMRRRAREIDGRFEIKTATGQGTSIIVTVPLHHEERKRLVDPFL